MPYQTDYVLRLVEQLSGLIRRAIEKLGVAGAKEPSEVGGRAIGLALGLDLSVASELSPQSIVALLELGNLDVRVIKLVAEAIEFESKVHWTRGEKTEIRREQASAVRAFERARKHEARSRGVDC